MVRWGHKFATSTPQKTILNLGHCVRQREFIKLHSDCTSLTLLSAQSTDFIVHSVFFHIKYWEGQLCIVHCTYYRHSAVALCLSLYISLSESVFFHYQRIEYWVGQSTVYRRDAVARQSLPDIEYFGGWSGLGYHHCPVPTTLTRLYHLPGKLQGTQNQNSKDSFWGSHKILLLPVKGPGKFVLVLNDRPKRKCQRMLINWTPLLLKIYIMYRIITLMSPAEASLSSWDGDVLAGKDIHTTLQDW